MKNKKFIGLAVAGLGLLGVASCGGPTTTEFTLSDGTKLVCKDTYNMVYQSETDKDKFNYLCNSWTYNSQQYTNMVDGLVENDRFGAIQGAIAESWTQKVNANGTQTWTFKLKKGVKWVDNSTGDEYAEVTADDFVAGIKYVLNPLHASATVGVVTGVINGSAAYYKALADGQSADFSTVGVKAVDKYTVEYTTPNAMPYFPTCLTYSPFLPVSQAYLDEKGSAFGNSENDILVNGAFRMTTHDYQSKIVLTANDKYWDKDHVYVNEVVETYLSGDASISTTREWYESGLIDGFTVQSTDEAGWAKYVGSDVKNPVNSACNAVLSLGDATYVGYFNFGRYTWEYDQGNKHVKTDAMKKDAAAYVQSTKGRQAVLYGLDVFRYLRRFGSDEVALQRLVRSYTIPELAVDEKGKDYTSYVVDVYNEKNKTNLSDLTGATNGKDPILNQEKAKALLAEVKTELAAKGATFPIYLDVIGSRNAKLAAFEKDMYDDFNNNVGKDVVQFNIVTPADDAQNTNWGSKVANYDFSIWSGWGPDYADPQTFLHTMVVDGDMVDSLGFIDDTTSALQTAMLGSYTTAYEKGAKITDSLADRYRAFAEAEYQLIYEDAIIVPWYTGTGYYNTVSKVVPYQGCRATYGLSSDKKKNLYVTEEPIDQATRAKIKADWEAGKNA